MHDLLDHPEKLIDPKTHPLLSRFSQPTLSRWFCKHKIRGVKIGGHWLTTDACVREFIIEATRKALAPKEPTPRGLKERREAEIAEDRRWLMMTPSQRKKEEALLATRPGLPNRALP